MSNMAEGHAEGLNHPSVDDLMDRVGSKYALVVVAAKRARQINAHYNGLDEGLLEYVGPTVEATRQDQPLTTALREIDAGNLQFRADDEAAGGHGQSEGDESSAR